MSKSSLIQLATALDNLADKDDVSIIETSAVVTAAGLNAAEAKSLLETIKDANAEYRIYDSSSTQVDSDPSDTFQPYRIEVNKIARSTTVLYTLRGLEDWFIRDEIADRVILVRLNEAFETFRTRFAPLNDQRDFATIDLGVDVQRFVRFLGEFRSKRIEDLLLRNVSTPISCPVMQRWANITYPYLLATLASECDDRSLFFIGPGTLIVSRNPLPFDPRSFCAAQVAAEWIYTGGRDAERKHRLFTSELARVQRNFNTASELFAESGMRALTGAKNAFAYSIVETSEQALRAVTQLRTSVIEEMGRFSDVSRQLSASVAGAFFGGFTVVLAQLSFLERGKVASVVISILALVLLLFIIHASRAALDFIRDQRSLRDNWRSKVHFFMSDKEYDDLVNKPIRRAEEQTRTTAHVSLTLAVFLFISIILTVAIN